MIIENLSSRQVIGWSSYLNIKENENETEKNQ